MKKYMHFFNKLPKYIEHAQQGSCFVCRKSVKNINAHVKSKHRSRKF